MGFNRIADWRVGGESTHKFASFLYTSFVGRINIQILNYPESFILVRKARPSADSVDGPEQNRSCAPVAIEQQGFPRRPWVFPLAMGAYDPPYGTPDHAVDKEIMASLLPVSAAPPAPASP